MQEIFKAFFIEPYTTGSSSQRGVKGVLLPLVISFTAITGLTTTEYIAYIALH